MFRKLTSATLIYALGPQLPKLVSIFMLPILTNYLTPQDYGINGIILAYVGAFDAFKDLGLKVILTNSFFKYPLKYKFIWERIHGFVQIWSPLYGLLLVPLIISVTPEFAKKDLVYIIICIIIPIMFFDPVSILGRQYFQLNKKPASFVSIAVISSFTAIAINYITIVNLRLGYLGFLIGALSSSSITFIFYFYLIYFRLKLLPSLKFSLKWLKRNLAIALPTIPHYYAGYVLNISDRVLLDFFKVSINEIGLYSFAYSIGSYFSIIGKSFQQASGPYYMELYKLESSNGDIKARSISYIMQSGLLIIAFFICLWMKELITFLARNEGLKNSYYLAIPIVMSYTYYPSYLFNSMKIWYTEKTNILMKISVASAIISISLNLLLIPKFGIVGAALTNYISFMFMGFGGYLYPSIRKEFKVKYYGGIWFVIITITTLTCFIIKDIPISMKFFISVILAFLVGFVFIFRKKVLLLFYHKI